MDDDSWPQVLIEFANRDIAEHVAVDRLRPELATAHADGLLPGWWFVRKSPCWRLRWQPTSDDDFLRLPPLMDTLAIEGRIVGWTAGIYEPEVFAFGGRAGMQVAHELFHADSRNILDHLARQRAEPNTPGFGRRELAIVLCSVLMRGAGLDWYEQGDVWARVTQHRPTDSAAPTSSRLRSNIERLMTVDMSPTRMLVNGGPLSAIAGWCSAFEGYGQQLAHLARRGRLERGLRAVLGHHVIFEWNRLGLPSADQSILSKLAKEVVMGVNETPASPPAASTGNTDRSRVHNTMTDQTPARAHRLLNELADRLRQQGTVRTDRIDEALRAVPRHLFVPGVTLDEAYADEPVYTKHDDTGASISAASQPSIVAMMLEQLQVQSGQRVLELGAGSGYHAGLLAYLVGEDGHVATIDVDEDIVDGARSGLDAAGFTDVLVLRRDGVLGYLDAAPYDRIVATVGAHSVPSAWLDQLAPHGRLVVPLRLRGSVSRSIVFERDTDTSWRSVSSEMCTFMPLRGIGDDARCIIPLTSDGAVTLWTNQDQTVDAAALTGVLDQPAIEAWTGVTFRGPESMEWMDLWLACTMDNGLSRMPVEQSAVESGQVKVQFRWGCMATTNKANLAYLTLRPTHPPSDGPQLYEIGVIGHGPGGDQLAGRTVQEIRTWDTHYRSRSVDFEIRPGDTHDPFEKSPGQFAFDTTLHRLIVAWR